MLQRCRMKSQNLEVAVESNIVTNVNENERPSETKLM